MAHDHAHHHDESYYLDQLCTIAACGLLGGIAFLLWRTDTLYEYNILVKDFRLWTLLGGVSLFGIAVVRGIALWSEVGRNKLAHAHDHAHEHGHHDEDGEPCDHTHGEGCDHDHHHDHEHGPDHDHEHGHDHSHEHSEHAHAHHHQDHGHSHGFAPWRYAVLLMPMMLAALLIYYHYQGLELRYSTDYLLGGTNEKVLTDTGPTGPDGKKREEVHLAFQELNLIAPNPAKHGWYEDKMGTLRGLYNPITDKQFSLMRWKMTCCGADAVPLKVRIISPEPLNFGRGTGVEVKGAIEFHQLDSGEYIPVMRLLSGSDIREVNLGNDIYER